MRSCHSGRLVSLVSVGSIVELLANVIATNFSGSSHSFGLSSRALPRSKMNYSGTLPGTERRLSISQSRRRKRAWVFEVKFFKYTLFARILLTHRALTHSISLAIEEHTKIADMKCKEGFVPGIPSYTSCPSW
jgi:hypothetical protein